MTAEEFIRNNPFPVNGTEINNQLVADIQDKSKGDKKLSNLNKLLKNNARLIWLIYKQYNYNQSLDSIMSFVYEGLIKACDNYDPKIGMPFYNYAMQQTRGLLQNHYNYTASVVHVPVMKKKKIELSYMEVDDFVEHKYCIDDSFEEDKEGSLVDAAITEYKHHIIGKEELVKELHILELSRYMILADISKKTGIGTTKVRKIIQNTADRISRFYKDFNRSIQHA